jgi:hypothetical protein
MTMKRKKVTRVIPVLTARKVYTDSPYSAIDATRVEMQRDHDTRKDAPRAIPRQRAGALAAARDKRHNG